MARRKQHWLVTLLVGKPSRSKSRRASSGRRKAGSHPLNVVRRYQRWATTVNSNRALSVKERNDLRDKNTKARVQLDQEIARKKARKAATKKAAADRREARVHAAATRKAQGPTPTVVRTKTSRRTGESRKRFVQRGRDEAVAAGHAAAHQRKPTPVEVAHAAKCGARTQDGTPCENPSLGDGPCAAGHHPKAAKPRNYKDSWRKGAPQQPGETNEQFLRRERFERSVDQHVRDRAHGPSAFQQDRDAKNRRDGLEACRCCGSYHGRQMRSGEHCSGCKGHTRANARRTRTANDQYAQDANTVLNLLNDHG